MEGFENEYNGCDQSKVNDGYENDIETNKERVELQYMIFGKSNKDQNEKKS